MISYKSGLISTSSALALTVSIAATAAYAAQQQASSVIEEVVVQARRVDENIQDVPITIIAIKPEKLQEQQIYRFDNLQKMVPGLTGTAGNRGAFIWLRGLAGISSYFADAPIILGPVGQYFDLESLQVLKGPQGTLFGQASTGGAFVIVPKKPTNDVTGFVSGALGSYGRRSIEGAINVPIFGDKLLARVALRSHYRNGFVVDIASNKRYEDENEQIGRVSLVFKPTDTIENYTVFNYYNSFTNGEISYTKNYMINNNPGACAGQRCDGVTGVTRSPIVAFTGQAIGGPGYLDTLISRWQKGGDLGPYKFDGLIQAKGFSGVADRSYMVINRTDWDITDDFTLSNIGQVRRLATKTRQDSVSFPNLAGTAQFNAVSNDPRAIAEFTKPLKFETVWSDELKLNGQLFNNFMNLTMGTFHTGYVTNNFIAFGTQNGVLTATLTKGDSRRPVMSRGAYVQSDFDLGTYGIEGLTGTLGYRYTWDQNSQRSTQWGVLPAYAVNPLPVEQLTPVRSLYNRVHFKYANWLAGLKYDIDTDTMAYVTASKGNNAGVVAVANPAPYNAAVPENLTQIEIGAKSTFDVGGVAIRPNLSAYYGWYNEVQTTTTYLLQINPPPAPPTSAAVTENAAKAIIRGIDWDITVVPAEWIEFNTGGALMKHHYRTWPVKNTAGAVIGDRSNTPLIGTPELKFNHTVTFHAPIPEEYGHLSMNWIYMFSGAKFFGVTFPTGLNNPYTYHTISNGYGPLLSAIAPWGPMDKEASFHQIDMSVTWADPMDVQGLTAVFSVTNVDKKATSYNTGISYGTGQKTWLEAPPRQASLTLRYNF